MKLITKLKVIERMIHVTKFNSIKLLEGNDPHLIEKYAIVAPPKTIWRNLRRISRQFQGNYSAVKFLAHLDEIRIVCCHQLLEILARCLVKGRNKHKTLNTFFLISHFSWLVDRILSLEFRSSLKWQALKTKSEFRWYFPLQGISGCFRRRFCSSESKVIRACRCWCCRERWDSFALAIDPTA